MSIEFALKRKDFSEQAAGLWGEILSLPDGRTATFEEAKADFDIGNFSGQFSDYFKDGKYVGPCGLGISVEYEGRSLVIGQEFDIDEVLSRS